jgi:hypothetical protein
LRDSNIAKSEEAKAVSQLISNITPFDKPFKSKKAIVDFSFVENLQEGYFELSLSWIPLILQNNKLLNIALLHILGVIRAKAKGVQGLLGGRMSTLLETMKKRHPGYVPVILLNMEPSELSESMLSLLNSHQPLLCDICVGIARFDMEDITDLILVGKGMMFED